jgi:hypothetical protein
MRGWSIATWSSQPIGLKDLVAEAKASISSLILKCKSTMSRRPAILTQADVARAIRAAKQAGAEAVEVRPDGTIIVLLKNPPIAPEDVEQAVPDDLDRELEEFRSRHP